MTQVGSKKSSKLQDLCNLKLFYTIKGLMNCVIQKVLFKCNMKIFILFGCQMKSPKFKLFINKIKVLYYIIIKCIFIVHFEIHL